MLRLSAALALTSLGLAGCDWMQKPPPKAEKTEKELQREQQARLRRACASDLTYDRLKELAFDEATRIRNRDPRDLDGLATASVVRMEEPVVKTRDEALNVTVCQGRFILELPPGAENAFDGERRLAANIEYAAQEAVDGSGLVYHMEGAEPIIYRLATVGGLSARPPVQQAGLPAQEPMAPPDALPQPQAPVSVPLPSGVPGAPRVAAREAPPVATTPPPRARERIAEAQPRPQPRLEPRKAAPAPDRTRTAASPSFNCNSARSRSERLVCGSGNLAALDRQMSSQFYSALAEAEPDARRRLRTTRDRFLRDRDRCSSDACVAAAYEARMREIRALNSH